jgi:hypothetical protein
MVPTDELTTEVTSAGTTTEIDTTVIMIETTIVGISTVTER